MKNTSFFYTQKTDILDSHNRTRYFRSTTITEHLTEAKAPAVFYRASSQGCNLVRYIVFWENIESVPDSYNEEFLAELRTVLKLASEYGLFVILEPTVATIDYNENKFTLPKWVLQKLELADSVDFPQTTNPYDSYAFKTFFTLFFGGNKFAKDFKIDGDNAQDFLQEHYIEAVYHLTRRLKDCDSVIGISTMSDLNAGFIGTKDLNELTNPACSKGITSSPFEQIKLASGLNATFSKFVNNGKNIKNIGNIQVSPKESLFLNNSLCLWAKLGVWENPNNKPMLLKPAFFASDDDFITPFESELIERIQKKHAHYLFFSKNINCSKIELKDDLNFVLCKEYCGELPTQGGLFKKSSDCLTPFLNENQILAKNAKVPFVFYDYTDFFEKDSEKVSNYFAILDKNKTSAFLGNEKSFSKMKAYPFPIAIAGTLLDFKFDEKSSTLEMTWNSTTCPTASGDADTELFLPKVFFPNGWNVEKFDGVGILREDLEQQRLFVKTLQEKRCYLKLTSK